MIWSKRWGTVKKDGGLAIATDGTGSIYAVGITEGDLFGANAGKADIFLAKFK